MLNRSRQLKNPLSFNDFEDKFTFWVDSCSPQRLLKSMEGIKLALGLGQI
jgi:hypothetical protein